MPAQPVGSLAQSRLRADTSTTDISLVKALNKNNYPKYELQVARGKVSGVSFINKFGRTTNVDSASATDIWDGANDGVATSIWVPPTTGRIHNIASTSSADDAASTGARTLTIYGLDSNWLEATETVTLDGTNNVATTNSYIRIYRMTCDTWGTGTVNAGIITATAQTDSTVTAAIAAGNNQTLMAIYTVPAGKTAYITEYYAAFNKDTGANTSTDMRLLVKTSADVANAGYQVKHIIGMFNASSGYINYRFGIPLKVTQKSDIVMRSTDCSANDTDMMAGFDIILDTN